MPEGLVLKSLIDILRQEYTTYIEAHAFDVAVLPPVDEAMLRQWALSFYERKFPSDNEDNPTSEEIQAFLAEAVRDNSLTR